MVNEVIPINPNNTAPTENTIASEENLEEKPKSKLWIWILGIALGIILIGLILYFISSSNNNLKEDPIFEDDPLIGTWSRISSYDIINDEKIDSGPSIFDGAKYFFREEGKLDIPLVETEGKILYSNFTYYVENNTIFFDSIEKPSGSYSKYEFEITGNTLTLTRHFYAQDRSAALGVTTLKKVK